MGDLGIAYLRHREQAHRQNEPITDLYRRLLAEREAEETKAAQQNTEKAVQAEEPTNA